MFASAPPDASLAGNAVSMVFLVGFFAVALTTYHYLPEIRDRLRAIRAAWRDITGEIR